MPLRDVALLLCLRLNILQKRPIVRMTNFIVPTESGDFVQSKFVRPCLDSNLQPHKQKDFNYADHMETHLLKPFLFSSFIKESNIILPTKFIKIKGVPRWTIKEKCFGLFKEKFNLLYFINNYIKNSLYFNINRTFL